MKDAFWVGPLTVFVMAGTFFAGGGHDGLTAWQWVSVVLAGAACLALLLSRSRPRTALLLTASLVGVYFACGFQDGPVYLPFFLGAYVVARAAPVRQWVPWVVGPLALVLAGMAVRAVTTGLGWWQPLGQSIGVTAIAATAATIGSLVRSRQQTAAERAARTATEEKLRMAQDLHDGVGHGLAVIAMQAGVALHVLDRDPAAARRALEAIRDVSRESLDGLRVELSRLSGAAPRTPERGLADLAVLADRVRAAGLRVSLSGTDLDVSDEAAHATYLIVQEALTNVLRHADAHAVEVRVGRTRDTATVSVVDDGVGAGEPGDGMGISGMRSRAAALGGSLVARPRTGGGFEVLAEVPL
jgi:signal transduction histidine kinase